MAHVSQRGKVLQRFGGYFGPSQKSKEFLAACGILRFLLGFGDTNTEMYSERSSMITRKVEEMAGSGDKLMRAAYSLLARPVPTAPRTASARDQHELADMGPDVPARPCQPASSAANASTALARHIAKVRPLLLREA